MTDEKLTEEQRRHVSQKADVLNGSYTPIPHELYREVLPDLVAKYDGQTARDCLVLYGYMHAYTNGASAGAAYLWAYPTVKQIREHTGIHGDRIKRLVDILASEGLLVTRKIPWYGHSKKMYMPMFRRDLL